MFSKKIHCTVYLEGINVNFNSVQISEQSGQPPRAVVSFPAESAALTLLPKTVIHVFYTDSSGQEVLIFMGELSGSGISFLGDKRSIQLTFAGLSQNWQTNVVIPMDLNPRVMASRALYAQITTNYHTDTKMGGTNTTAASLPSSSSPPQSNLNLGTLIRTPKVPWNEVRTYISKAESSNVDTAVNKANKNKTEDSGRYQINDVHIAQNDDKSPMRQKIDQVFISRGITSTDINVKRAALKNAAPGPNGESINEEIAKIIYAEKGINAWSSRETVLAEMKKAGVSTAITDRLEAEIIPLKSVNAGALSGQIIDFANLKGISPLDPLIDRLESGEDLSVVLEALVRLFSIDSAGIYWAMLAKAFGFMDMVVVDKHPGILEIEKLLRKQATLIHIKGLADGTPAGRPIHDLITTILSSMGLDYCEIAAPTYLGGNTRGHIFIKPQTQFFPPIKHNIVFDDNIAQLSFSRDFDSEPTRMLAQTVPFYITGSSELLAAIVGVIIPGNVALLKGITATIASKEDYENIKAFGLSPEEQCRGVALTEYQDKTGIEQAYLQAVREDSGKDPKTSTDPVLQNINRGISSLFPASMISPSDSMKSVQSYHANIASIQFYNRRHAPRSVQVNSPYSPYRMVGFPGVIISKYFPAQTPGIVGKVDSIISHISADGDATQTLVFTHCRFVDENPTGQPRFGFLDDDIIVPIPWYADYTKQASINAFYKQFTGESKSAVVDVNASPEKSISEEIKKIKKDLDTASVGTGGNSLEAYILKITKRPLVPRALIDKLFPVNDKSIRVLSDAPVTSYAADKIFPYVKERRERILAAFSIVKRKKV